MKKLKYLNLILVFVVLVVLVIQPNTASSENKSYYSGDAINYKGQVIIGSVNMGYFELFKLDSGKIKRMAILTPTESVIFGNKSFYDLLFSEEEGKLYVYLVDGRALYKYDISYLEKPFLAQKAMDNSWDWFMGLDKYEDRIITIGTKEVKIWKQNLVNINAYNLKNKNQLNLTSSNDGNLFFNIINNNIHIVSAISRNEITSLPISVTNDHFRKAYNNPTSKSLYVVDDYALRYYQYDSVNNFKEKASYKHSTDLGYDVSGVLGKSHLYFSDGYGVTKVDAYTLKSQGNVFTTGLGTAGGWAMGLKAVKDGDGEKIVLFNNSCILVLNDSLKLVDYYASSEKNTFSFEDLALSTDKQRASGGYQVTIGGQGYGINEDLTISLAGTFYKGVTDNQGRFRQTITVPSVLPTRTEIKVQGVTSARSYSISFEII